MPAHVSDCDPCFLLQREGGGGWEAGREGERERERELEGEKHKQPVLLCTSGCTTSSHPALPISKATAIASMVSSSPFATHIYQCACVRGQRELC
jgi:hypothetical protein